MTTRGHNPTGFTLVEMLAVILVIGILVAVVVGVAGNVIARASEDQTRENMATIMNAIDAYFEEKGEYPSERGSTVEQVNANLFNDLNNCEKSKKRLGGLSRTAVRVTAGRHFQDGFDKVLKYHSTGGAGGRPYLESAGRDGSFGDPKNTNDPALADNIRSDGR
jgi:prepilin-type N-terminal cleavage/methylation domain-containing protein